MGVTAAAAASQSGAEPARVEHRAEAPHKARAAKSPDLGDRLVLCAADLAREKRKRTCGEGYPALKRGEKS